MKRNDLPQAVRKRWTDRYISALIDSIGAATILGLHEDCKLLHDLTSRAAGLTNGAESDTMKSNSPKRAENEEVKKMRAYDLITDSTGKIKVYSAGLIEKTFRLSLKKSETINIIFVISSSGEKFAFRYSADEKRDEEYKKFIKLHYIETGETKTETITK